MSLEAAPHVSPSQPVKIQVTLNHIDYAVTKPGPLDNSDLPVVPVIRIYGNSSTGQKTCLHVHQVFPYFYIDYPGSLKPKDVRRYTSSLLQSLNHAIAVSLKRNPQSSKARYIRAIVLVKGVHFYGFHSSYSPFLKILVADPTFVNRTVTILRSGSVMGTRFRIYESHLSFPLQFMCDFGLYGCGTVDLQDAWQRCSNDEGVESDFEQSPHYRQSTLPLEIDVIAPQILNRHQLGARNVAFKIGEPIPTLPNEPLVLSVRELWEDERDRRKAKGLEATPKLPTVPSDASRGSGAAWVAEARYWESIRNRIEGEAKTLDPVVTEVQPWEGRVMTTFESIEAVWEAPWKQWKPAPRAGPDIRPDIMGEDNAQRAEDLAADADTPIIDVDVSLISNEGLDDFDEDTADILGKGGIYDAHEDVQTDDEGQETVGLGAGDQDAVQATSSVQGSNDDPFAAGPNEVPLREVQEAYTLESPPSPDAEGKFVNDERGSITPTRDNLSTSRARKTPRALSDEETTPTRRKGHFPDFASNNERRPRVSFEDVESQDEGDLSGQPGGGINNDETQDTKSNLIPSANEERNATMILHRTVQLTQAYEKVGLRSKNQLQYAFPSPSTEELLQSLDSLALPQKLYQPPYYSLEADVPDKPKEYGGLMFNLKGSGVAYLDEWKGTSSAHVPDVYKRLTFDRDGIAGWEYAGQPPSVRQTKMWLKHQAIRPQIDSRNSRRLRSQIEGPTQANIYGLKTSPNAGDALRETSSMSILALEVFALSANGKNPNADKDEIVAVFYALHVAGAANIQNGLITVRSPALDPRRLRDFSPEQAENEMDLVNKTIDVVMELDPDILTGWEIQKGSWGYLAARAKALDLDLSELIARAPPRYSSGGNEQWGFRKTSTFQVIGRHVFNAWRIIRSEQTLTIYTFENVAFHVLQRRFPKYSPQTLTDWYTSPVPAHTARALQYYATRTHMVLEILEQIEIVTKTAEFARIFGVDFFSVISRGSQFKVESFMFRIAKPESFVLISPSKDDVGRQNAAECMPLIMEPTSAFYSSPLVVLDFQSLYPSIMIAYNYCYSTCLGRVQPFQGRYKFGVVDLDLPDGLVGHLKDDIHVAPNGMMYVKSTVRRGLLGRMLIELLDTRVMVKQAMKGAKNDKALKRVLDARQLGLKYIANVTYGYTSASYSGRMPAVEIADSIVQSGRETLEKAIMLVNSTKKWGAQVVYGDTDSMFIYLRGKTKEEAFRIGNEMADTVTALNPAPIKLKFEKVYLPCVLMAKKRYVGFKYETLDAEEPGFDAKGIETVRRDGVLAQRKMTENCLKILFRTQDLSEVKEYCCRSWSKLLENKASTQDFIFAKEVRMGSYSETGVPQPGVIVAARKMLEDTNYEPQYAERVPYVIARGGPGSRLVDKAMDPLDFLNNSSLQLDANYYITRVLIPPLERIFNLMGADVKQWYQQMPKLTVVEHNSPRKARGRSASPEKPNIDEHFNNAQCIICGQPATEYEGLCEECWANPPETISNLGALTHRLEEKLFATQLVCASCTGCAPSEPMQCESLDCPWLYARRKAETRTEFINSIAETIVELEHDMEETLSQM